MSVEWNVNQVWSHLDPDGCEWICCRVESFRSKSIKEGKMPEHTMQSRLMGAADLKLIIDERR